MDHTLVLNASYEPLRVVSWQKAITLLFKGKVEVLANYDREIRGVTIRVRQPSVLRLLHHVRTRRAFTEVPFSRANVYARDNHRCQYCGRVFAQSALNLDHVVPLSRGGGSSWDNVVCACVPCNTRKGDRTPLEAGMRLFRHPRKPAGHPMLRARWIGPCPEEWKTFLDEAYWNVELSDEIMPRIRG